jgi:uncharacterized repeat protein (TIGR02543 family)
LQGDTVGGNVSLRAVYAPFFVIRLHRADGAPELFASYQLDLDCISDLEKDIEGLLLIGFYLDEGFTQPITADFLKSYDDNNILNVYARYVQASYTVEFIAVGFDCSKQIEFAYYTQLNLADCNPQIDGYIFLGWFTECGAPLDTPIYITEDIQVFAHFQPRTPSPAAVRFWQFFDNLAAYFRAITFKDAARFSVKVGLLLIRLGV